MSKSRARVEMFRVKVSPQVPLTELLPGNDPEVSDGE